MTQDRPAGNVDGQVSAVFDRLLTSGPSAARLEARAALEALNGTWRIDDRTRSNIYATAQGLVASWQDPGVIAAARTTDITLPWLLNPATRPDGRGANTLYLCAPTRDQQRLAPVFGGLIGDLLNQAYDQANRTGEPVRDLLIVMDEAGNTPARWLPETAATCAGIGILLVTVWQSKAQIEHAFGTLADSIITNHATKIIYSGVSDLATLRYASELVGDEEVQQTSRANDTTGTGRRTLTESATRTPLLPGYVLRQVRPGEALLVHGTLPPAHLRGRPWYDDDRLRKMAAYGE